MKTKITINNTKELKIFVKRKDVSIGSAFDVTDIFIAGQGALGIHEDETNFSVCVKISVIGGNDQPDFTKQDIVNWIDDYEKDPKNCKATFSWS